ncbi:MAG: VCBS repeat-containing protein [Phycisphaeraceae bacterium]|nr:VCBS repeat-containing protein [Phycisphaeraceae bacterium]
MRNYSFAPAAIVAAIAAAATHADPPLVPDNSLFRGSQTVLPDLHDCCVQNLTPTQTRVTAAAGTLIRILQTRSGQPPQSHVFDMAPRIPERIFPFNSANPGLVITTKDEVLYAPVDPDGVPLSLQQILDSSLEPFGGIRVAIGDVTGNGQPDIVVTGNETASVPQYRPIIRVFKNDGANHFTDHQTILPPVSVGFVTSIKCGDINNDGRPEFSFCATNESYFLTSIPNGTLAYLDTATGLAQNTAPPPLDGFAGECEFHDLNGDNRDDFIAPLPSGGFAVYLAQPNSILGAPSITPGDILQRIVCADFDGDGNTDFFGAGGNIGAASLYPGLGNGSFAAPITMDGPANPSRVGIIIPPIGETFPARAFFSVHRDPEVIQNYLITPEGPVSSDRQPFKNEFGSAIQPSAAALADLNGDGFLDLVTSEVGRNLFFSLNTADGSGQLLPPLQDRVDQIRHLATLAPAPGEDARARIATNIENQPLGLILRLDSPSEPSGWEVPQVINLPQSGVGVATGDLDGDGTDDLVFTHTSGPAAFTRFIQDESGMFVSGASFGAPGNWPAVACANLNGQLGDEVILADPVSGIVQTYLNNGSGSFSPSVSAASSLPVPLSNNIVTGDVTGDGVPDVIIGAGFAGLSNGSVRVLPGDGFGGLGSSIGIPTDAPVVSVAVADLDGDGLLDIIAGTLPPLPFVDGRFAVILNTPSGLPLKPTSFHYISGDPKTVLVADLKHAASQREKLSLAALSVATAPGEGLTVIDMVPSSACPADLNNDGFVEDSDFVIFLAAYNILDCADPSMPAGCPADFNSDNAVDDADFVIFVPAYNDLICP